MSVNKQFVVLVSIGLFLKFKLHLIKYEFNQYDTAILKNVT